MPFNSSCDVMTTETRWVAEFEPVSRGWSPVLVVSGCMFPLDLVVATEAECLEFIRSMIPAGSAQSAVDVTVGVTSVV
jgi:hypothetical protein